MMIYEMGMHPEFLNVPFLSFLLMTFSGAFTI